MSEGRAVSFLSETQYLAVEFASSERAEFVDGTIRAMTGASIRHNAVALGLASRLLSIVRGTGCRVTIEGVRLRINSKRHYYPDVMASCEPPSDSHSLSAPCLIAEVLSPTTQAVDRGEKRIAYMAMPSLRNLLLIDIDGKLIDHTWRKSETDPWMFELGLPGGILHLLCPAVAEIVVDDLFDGLFDDLPEAGDSGDPPNSLAE